MQKYIAVVNPKMDEDEITRLIRKGIAGALFEISHQNYPVAMRLIDLVQKLSRKYNHPISLIQDVSNMQDPLDLAVGAKSGAHWVATDKEEHLKQIKGLNKLAGIIFKNKKLPKGFRVDSVMASDFLDPDAEIPNSSSGQIKHLITEHAHQKLVDTLSALSEHSHAAGIAVSDLDLARALSHRRFKKTIFVTDKDALANKAAIYWGVHPVLGKSDTTSSAKNSGLFRRGERFLDASDRRHIAIHVV